MFITFYQNNSGGYFIKDENVCEFVIIEGDSFTEIMYRAENLFKDYREYCPCCGERWDDDYKTEKDLTEEPEIYGDPISDLKKECYNKSVIIHWKNEEI